MSFDEDKAYEENLLAKRKFEDYLKEKFPVLFSEINLPKEQLEGKYSISWYGLEISPGWYPIIEEASAKIEALNAGIVVHQIKEKFGGLRYYTTFPPEEIRETVHKIIRDAEAKCDQTCEYCGEPGQLMSNTRWFKTLCPKHYRENDRPHKWK